MQLKESKLINELLLEKSKVRILLLEGVHDCASIELRKHGFINIEELSESISEPELIKKIRGIHILGIRSRTQLTSHVLRHANRLIAIGCFCVGTNQVDLEFASQKGICVFNAPHSNTRSVAEMVMAEAILLLRRIPEKNSLMHSGFWNKSSDNSYEVRGKILGIIGYGQIGGQLSVLAEALGMSVIFYDINPKLPLGNAKQVAQLSDILTNADAISLHVPATPQTKGIIGKEQFSLMKKSSVFINASRGNCVDIDALNWTLKIGHLLGAAIDVFPVEPSCNGKTFISSLQGLSNVILTPHIGGSTSEAQMNVAKEVSQKLIQFWDLGITYASVNFPEVSGNLAQNKYRLILVHNNVPGVLSSVNEILSSSGTKISTQQFATRRSMGYLIIDLDTPCDNLDIEKIREITGAIKIRMLRPLIKLRLC